MVGISQPFGNLAHSNAGYGSEILFRLVQFCVDLQMLERNSQAFFYKMRDRGRTLADVLSHAFQRDMRCVRVLLEIGYNLGQYQIPLCGDDLLGYGIVDEQRNKSEDMPDTIFE